MRSILKMAMGLIAVCAIASCGGSKNSTSRPKPAKEVNLFTDLGPTSEGLTANSQTVTGVWEKDRPSYDGRYTDLFRIKVEQQRILLTARCTVDQKPMYANASTKIKITDTSIEVLESVEKVINDGENSCPVYIDAGKVDYRISNGRLTLTVGGEFVATMIKITD